MLKNMFFWQCWTGPRNAPIHFQAHWRKNFMFCYSVYVLIRNFFLIKKKNLHKSTFRKHENFSGNTQQLIWFAKKNLKLFRFSAGGVKFTTPYEIGLNWTLSGLYRCGIMLTVDSTDMVIDRLMAVWFFADSTWLLPFWLRASWEVGRW